jgi:hypothetical protein
MSHGVGHNIGRSPSATEGRSPVGLPTLGAIDSHADCQGSTQDTDTPVWSRSPVRIPTLEPIGSHANFQNVPHRTNTPIWNMQQRRTNNNLDYEPLLNTEQRKQKRDEHIPTKQPSEQDSPGQHFNNKNRDRSPIRFPTPTPGARSINTQANTTGSNVQNLKIRQEFQHGRLIMVQNIPNTDQHQGHQYPHKNRHRTHTNRNEERRLHDNRSVKDSDIEDIGNKYCQVTPTGYMPHIHLPQPLRSKDPVVVWGKVNTFLSDLAKDIEENKDQNGRLNEEFDNKTAGYKSKDGKRLSYAGHQPDKERPRDTNPSRETVGEVLLWIPGMEPHQTPQADLKTQSEWKQQYKKTGGHYRETMTNRAMIKRKDRMHRSAGMEDRLNFHRDQQGIIIKTSAGHPRCNYCFIASHARDNCKYRQVDMEDGIDRLEHPKKGLLQSRNHRFKYDPNGERQSTTHLLARTHKQYRRCDNNYNTNKTKKYRYSIADKHRRRHGIQVHTTANTNGA